MDGPGKSKSAARGTTRAELPISSDHVAATESLPPIHKDPFDRILVAQATVEGITLLTVDSLVSQYPGPIKAV